jgi:hypothetical protein
LRVFVGLTDYDWSRFHASRENVEEINFWRPSSKATFKALLPGELFLFELHSLRNFIAGSPKQQRRLNDTDNNAGSRGLHFRWLDGSPKSSILKWLDTAHVNRIGILRSLLWPSVILVTPHTKCLGR